MDTFELRNGADGRYYFTFRTSAGDAIADSLRYTSRRHALDALDLLRRNAYRAPIEDRTGEVLSNKAP